MQIDDIVFSFFEKSKKIIATLLDRAKRCKFKKFFKKCISCQNQTKNLTFHQFTGLAKLMYNIDTSKDCAVTMKKGNISMKRNVVRVIPNGKHKATIKFYTNPKRPERGNQEELQKLSLQYFIDKVSSDNIFYEKLKDNYINIIFELEDGTLFEPLPIKNTLQKGSVLRRYFESFGFDDIKDMRTIDDDTMIKTHLIIETKKFQKDTL